MSSILHANMDSIEILLDVPNTIRIPRPSWHIALAVYFSRVLLSRRKKSAAKKNHIILSSSPSKTIILFHQNDVGFGKVDKEPLTQLVREKNLDQLRLFEGVRGLASILETNTELGIHGDPKDITHRHEAFDSNTYSKPPPKSFLYFVWEATKDVTIFILLGCSALSLAFGIKEDGLKEGWYDGGSIIIAVFLVVFVSAISNYRQSMQFNRLSKVGNNIQIDVIRGGRRQQVSIFEIVVGDVVFLKIGDQVPADGLFLDGHSLQVDESSMTGESGQVEVNHGQNPFLFSGTKVVDGYGRMLVTSVGMNTSWGQMMSQINGERREETPLQARLNKLTSSIGKVGLAVALVVLVALLVRYFTGNTKDENGNQEFNGGNTKIGDVVNSVLGIVAAAVTIVVVAIPEGLPLAVTLTLAYSMKRMMADNAMVRKLSACETMGSATTICTDKTGTLTLNQMRVTKFWLGQVEGGAVSFNSSYVLDLIREGIAMNTTGSVYRPDSDYKFEFSGSPTEKAILSWAVLELNMDMEELKRSCSIEHVETFNSQRKRSGVLIRRKADNTKHVYWKGAAEIILAMCSTYYNASGILEDLDEDEKKKFELIIQGMAATSLRCIAFAHKQVEEEQNNDDQIVNKNVEEENLTLLGLVGLKDPCRPGVRKAVEDCQNAGVNIKMITGDNIFTAKAIATECGILRTDDQDMSNGAVIEGAQFRNLTQTERMQKVDKICVMARSSPFDKLLMVQCLRQKGHVVAVTGDGTNDAPALKEADIGLSMGIEGTEVAKESSDIVILDDNFASLATVLRWGRCVYNNIQKFIQFQLTVNVSALVINFVAAISAGEVPLTAVQLLWVNLIMDTLGALALATEQPTKELMENPPVGRSQPLITNTMWRNLLAQALYQVAVLLTLQFKGQSIFGINKKVNDTLIFNVFVLCQLFNEFNARQLEKKNVFKGIHRNKLFLGIVSVTVVLQVLMVEVLKRFAGTERLKWGQWGICVGVAALSWPIGFLVKFIPVPDKPILEYLRTRKVMV
ncbi:putative calcium-transporting ATPase 13, plasma membrane-type [Ziziphus jujuba]|uniref:Calcium-transporting ATPase n=1 Tax=Ziziphus jujuba TaxID=326968 RepID=A0A6P4AHT4_ZIZJJ|nr:putative calcium-transporting ATPase 13, plasma membrane-type [Ziziphus jujuba]